MGQRPQSPRGYSEQGGIPARMLNSVHDFPVYIVNYYIQYKVLVNQDKEFSWGLTRDDVNCRTGRQNEQYHSRTAPFRNPEVLTFPARGGSIFSDEICARRSLSIPKVQYSTGVVTYSQSIIHRGLRVLRIACERITINYCRVMAAMRMSLIGTVRTESRRYST